MVVYVAKEITSSVAGGRLDEVTCEQCQQQFAYELVRVGVGKGTASYYIGQTGAANRAAAAAERDLSKRLDEDAELVPCPKCHWVNEDLIARFRKRLYRRAPLLIVILVVAAFIAPPIAGAGLMEWLGYNSRVPFLIAGALFFTLISSPAWVLLIRQALRRRINPNVRYPSRPSVPAGTPPALVRVVDAATHETIWSPAHPADAYSSADQTWAIFRPGQIDMPDVCCVCLAKASTRYAPPLATNERSDLDIPLCTACQATLRSRWWRTLLLVALVAYTAAGVTAYLVPIIDSTGRWMIFAFFGSSVSLVGGVIIAGQVARPYRLRVVDAERGILRFAASHPGYTALIQEQIKTRQ